MYTKEKKSSCEDSALTTNPAYDVPAQLIGDNNDNLIDEKTHHREPVLELNYLQREQKETADTAYMNEVETHDYYATICD